ncbi:PREDICTED: centrosomal protein KIAA1731 homolog [Elephantulus edwardii]|uniref:centrosomal protein KIAA1731 homolog n=1 Tax=Elephantulus edwardii TaxID=28737 RepID=UPI0003F0E779|nr:PREDICTED: centrosomal protein KIAA1731 homolog [Elephantulus edwardii]
MKRKVVKAGRLRLSPNEEAFILKEDYERRRKLRLLQVREQERDIALQIREDIKQRRNQQFARLAEELKAEWEESQTQKIKNLERLYLASLRNMGEGHRQAKENEPDLDGLAQRAAERKRRAEIRHKEALKIQKNQKELLMRQKTRHIKARKEALLVEKERSAKITSLPPPPPTLFENIDIKKIPSIKTSGHTYHHLYTLVNREMDTKQPDPHLAAEEEAKRLEELQKQVARERLEQVEKAHVRGFHAMKKVHLAQNQEKLMKELEQLQQEDLARRRQNVARMPPQLAELPYRRSEMKDDWQRELEFAFEDMYNADRKVKGDLILHLEPEPLPTVTDQTQDEELDLSMEQENVSGTETVQMTESTKTGPSEIDVPVAMETQRVPSKILFKRLLNKIRSQKSLWTIPSMSEDENEMITTTSESESKAPTVETGAAVSEEQAFSIAQDHVLDSDTLTIESGALTSEDNPPSYKTDSENQQEVNETQPIIVPAQSSVLLHPQEEAARIRILARQKQIMEIEEQKQKQLDLLDQIEQQKLRLEADCLRAQLEEERKKAQQAEDGIAPAPCSVISDEESHRRMIRNYQHQIVEQNRLHRQSVAAARKQLNEYQTMLKERYLSVSSASLIADSVISVPPQKPERPTVKAEHWDQVQRPKLSPHKCQPTQSSRSEQSHFQLPRQDLFLQRPVEAVETLGTSNIVAKQSLESQEQLRLLSQAEMQQRDHKLVPEDSHKLSRVLSHDRPLMFQDTKEILQTSGATAFQTLESQQMCLEDSQSLSSRLTEPSLFLPLVAERSFSSLPGKDELGRIPVPVSTRSKSTFSLSPPVIISQMQDRPLPYSQHITAQQDNLKVLQEQLELQKEVLQARKDSQEKLLLHKQKELEEKTGLSFIPSVAPHLSASLPSTKLGRIQESSLTKSDSTVYSGRSLVSHVQDSLLNFPQFNLSQQENPASIHEHFSLFRDRLQARREAQEVLGVPKRSEFDRNIPAEQAEPQTFPSQHAFTSQASEVEPRNIQQQYSSKSEKAILSSQPEISVTHDKSSSFLQQFLPLHDKVKLLQEQLTRQRDALEARHEAQAKSLLHRQKDVEVAKSEQMRSSLLTMVEQDSLTLLASAKVEPKEIQKLSLSEDSLNPSSHLVFPTFQDKSLSSSQHSLHQGNLIALQGQSHIQRIVQDTKQETREFIPKHNEVDKRLSFEQTDFSSSPFQIAESERSQELMSLQNGKTVPLSHCMIPKFPERLPQHMPLLREEWETEALLFSQRAQENTSSEQPGSASFIPQLGQLSCTSLSSAVSGTLQEPVLMESSNKIPSSHLQIPQLQDRLLRISQLIQPQQENLKLLQEQLTTLRESVVQSQQEAQEGYRFHERWKERISPERVDSLSSLPQVALCSSASSFTKLERTQESGPTKSDSTVASSHSEVPRLPHGLLDVSKSLLPQDHLNTLQEHFNAQTNVLISSEKTQKELVLPGQCKSEESLSCEQFVQPPYSDLKALQHQLDVQRRTIQSSQKIEEELLLQRLSKLEERVSSEQKTSSLLPQVRLPVADSQTQEPFLTNSSTILSNHPEIPGIHARSLTLSQSVLPQQVNPVALQEKLDLQREELSSSEKTQEELLFSKQNKFSKTESSELHTTSSLSLPTEAGHSFLPLPFAETQPKRIYESNSSNSEQKTFSSSSMIPKLQDILHFSQPVLAQQDNLGLQKQLNFNKKSQEEVLVHRQTVLQQQIQKHQETLKDFFKDNQTSNFTVENYLKTQKQQLGQWFPFLQDVAKDGQADDTDRNNSDHSQLLSDDPSTKESGKHLDKELGRRPTKPPLAKVKRGLNLNQHELSAIQEVDSPGSARTSIQGKTYFYQDRDPMRVSISREQNFLDSSLDFDSFSRLQPVAQKTVSGDDYEKAAKVKDSTAENHEVLSHTVEEQEHTYSSSTVKSDDKVRNLSHEPLSSFTISTRSLCSFENPELSLADTVSPADQVEHRSQQSTSRKEEGTPLSSLQLTSSSVPPVQAINQGQDSWDIHKAQSPAAQELTSGQRQVQQIIDKYINEANMMPGKQDFKELEHTFPNLHHQLFKPLEPQLDFDLLSLSSGISQDSRDFYKGSESSPESLHGTVSPQSSVSCTALRRSLHSSLSLGLNQHPEPNFVHVAAQGFVTESSSKGSTQSFQQLLPEISSQDESQHADLPSVCSIEAGDFARCMENQNQSSEDTPQIMEKDVHFPVSLENLLSSSHDGHGFNQLHVQHSTPCGSTSSECSRTEPLEDKKRSCFKDLSEEGLQAVVQNQALTEDDNQTSGVLDTNPHAEESCSQSCEGTGEMASSVQAPCSLTIQNEKYLNNSHRTETPEILRNFCQPAQSEMFHTSIPVWETESGQGIMEEPELTLVSTSDISIAEADLENLTLEENVKEEKGCLQSEFLPLVPETSECSSLPENSGVKSLIHSTETNAHTAMPENLQEAFLRKKSFIERSTQRQKEIKDRAHVTEDAQTQPVDKLCAGSASPFKGVNTIRVSIPEDRTTAQVCMSQRALKSYNELADGKEQRQEKGRQETNAQNRAKAREFQKKTLEKLRAKTIC